MTRDLAKEARQEFAAGVRARMSQYSVGDRVRLPDGRLGVVEDIFTGPLSGKTVVAVGGEGYYGAEFLSPAEDAA